MFRVTIRGTFGELDEAGRAALLEEAEGFGASFTEAGTFTCDSSLSAFTFRCQIPPPAEGEEADEEGWAALRAADALEAHGHPHRILRLAVTDMRDIKIRRKSGTGGKSGKAAGVRGRAERRSR
ncbi:DUF6204 family protein [Streptomyces sp. NBC_01795]|uniref:DUF6204 family protein n=1 Tax=Streptomyces sp. NBC_01795 TaxID=2975943 RepID=UPI002DDB02E7|nr:DUF6204 family protein [Streptomyces sp. NBC_01795]WSA96801.1 DUF6204 family protein [Streptomyces sp. NBC_01795]